MKFPTRPGVCGTTLVEGESEIWLRMMTGSRAYGRCIGCGLDAKVKMMPNFVDVRGKRVLKNWLWFCPICLQEWKKMKKEMKQNG